MTQIVNMIVAVGRSGQLGLNGTVPWFNADTDAILSYAKAKDMSLFKHVTENCIMIAGTTTYADMSQRISQEQLEKTGRELHQFSRSLFSSAEAMLESLGDRKPIWIVGGAQTYEEFMPFVNGISVLVAMPYDGPADIRIP